MESNVGIVVSGGPAPGINTAIHAVVIEARNAGLRTFGLQQGFAAITLPESDAVSELTIDSVSRIFNRGGSILGTSRFNPLKSEKLEADFYALLKKHSINQLVVIGGEGSAWISHQLTKKNKHVRVVHIPKTIDNDLILPQQYPSFGFETARFAGTRILDTLLVDAKTCGRWYVVTTMGRKAGFLALGLGVASSATLTLIPEEFQGAQVTLDALAEIIFSSAERRYRSGKPYGLALLAEGILDRIDPESCPELAACPRDELGRLRYADLELSSLLVPRLRAKAAKQGMALSFTGKDIGHELRCHEPVPFDIEYTKYLGYGAVKCLVNGITGVMVTRGFSEIGMVPLADLVTADGSIKARTVDVQSEVYKVARSFMLR